jgi:hypothetical protein
VSKALSDIAGVENMSTEDILDEDDMGLFKSSHPTNGSVTSAPADGDGSASVSNSGSRKARDNKQCGACGKPEVLLGNTFCPQHRRVVESMATHFKSQDKANGTKRAAAFAERRRLNKGHDPPSDLSKEILAFEVSNPNLGRGVKRIIMDGIESFEEQKNTQGSRSGVKLVKMHKVQWIKHATTTMCYSDTWAKEKWLDVEATVEKDQTDEMGPPESRLRLPVPTEDFVEGFSQAEHAKSVRLSSKRQKITDEKLAEAQQDAMVDFKGFQNDLFKPTGGSAIAAAGTAGLSSSVNLRGQGAYQSTSESSQVELDRRILMTESHTDTGSAKDIGFDMSHHVVLFAPTSS